MQDVVLAMLAEEPAHGYELRSRIMEPSGCGESTLPHLLGGLQRPTGGEVWLADRRIDTMSERALARLRRDTIGLVFQSFHLMDELKELRNTGQTLIVATHDALIAAVADRVTSMRDGAFAGDSFLAGTVYGEAR
ncbi:ATP-binding cassette domain-containing protein [Micromonospora sp. NPDC049230]|uniref:ATP-binding cassette domain-containing protein n=1 Tax=Micromonospora sp. NPDC049230 TaxID=3155502 RepID=UPI00340C7EC5